MNFITMLMLALSLAMDAFAVSIIVGIKDNKATLKDAFIMAGSFGFFQWLMTVLGFFAGTSILSSFHHIDNWVAFALLSFLGDKMIYDAFFDKKEEKLTGHMSIKAILLFSIATSIDALAAGVSITAFTHSILIPAIVIGIVTFLLSIIGFSFGEKLGAKFGKWMEVAGGLVLIGLGVLTLLEAYVFNH